MIDPKIPVIFLAFANERSEDGFLRELTTEMKLILDALEPAVQRGRCHVKVLPSATQEEIMEVFQDEWYQGRIEIFHYGGHATESSLWLENADGGNQAFFSLGLTKFLGAQEGLGMVFLNGCATKDHAKNLHDAQIPAVIGTATAIPDLQAREFSQVFYQGLAGGASLREAYDEAQGAVLGDFPDDHFISESPTRSLFWDEEHEEAQTYDFPWKLTLRSTESWIAEQWRLFHVEAPQVRTINLAAGALIGKEVANHELVEVLGEGTTGTVYLARHLSLNEERAIKITHPVAQGYSTMKDILYAGNQGLSSIDHPNVAQLYDVGEVKLFSRMRLYMVMELIKGDRLDEVAYFSDLKRPDDVDQAIDIMTQIAAGLEAAHKTQFTDLRGMPQNGIIHGNIKTRKILFTPEGVPKLIDFSFTDLSRNQNIVLEQPESVKNLLKAENLKDFTAPEILKGQRGVSKQSDIYGLGAVFFHILSGKPRGDFHFQTEEALHRFVKNRHLIFPRSLSKTIFEATQMDFTQRSQTVAEVI
ncbi:MAG: protein kinase, partial [Bacteroidota bacterium]